MSSTKSDIQSLDGVAIVGMAGKFPGVENINEYWDAIIKGKELLKHFSDDELNKNGTDSATTKHKYFVPVNGLIHTAEYFDASFFGFTPREADLTDPQHRKFLEVCYEALEHAGQSPDNVDGSVGVFAGCSMNNYLLKNLLQYPELLKNNGEFQTIVNNDKDFLTTKVSYKLNLTGPSFDIQTACSTSLVAIHVACQNLLNFQCDVAMGGGAFIMNPRGQGYMFKPGGIESPDGTCKPFDKDAEGTVFGEGVGVVVLKRLEDAVADKDEIWAVIKSSAINNDGSFKIGYMAPSAEGQAEAISLAMQFGDIDARSISYVEAHGTGTNLGDPIELSGLTQVFRKYTQDKNYCAIGSVKGNIGHCDVAAGVAGIIKTAMALKYKKIPPSINFNTANPELDLESSPFYVNTELKDWEVDGIPRRASISSFGIGGTNAHCILEEWKDNNSKPSENEAHLLPLTAKSTVALDAMLQNIVHHLDTTEQEIADVAHTLQTGRNYYNNRTLLVGRNKEEIVKNFKSVGESTIVKGKQQLNDPSVVFMITGQGSQYVNMAKGLYDSFDLYKNIVDEASDILSKKFNIDVKGLLFQSGEDKKYKDLINLTSNTQPLLFVVQYATACLLIELGVFPNALIGHSIGELTAATLSGVFSFEDALHIVASRGKIMQEQKTGSMLSVNLSAEKITPLLNEHVELALQNAPNYSVISGSDEAIIKFEKHLNETIEDLHTTVLKTSHAFHSSLMDPALGPFIEVLKKVNFGEPEIPFISNVTGTWIKPEEACSVEYWANHIRSTVLFSDGIHEIFQSEDEVLFLEVGPGNSLSMLLSQFDITNKFKSIPTMRHPRTQADDVQTFYKAVSDFWISGGNINWEDQYEEDRYKVPLPSYPFEKARHWIDPLVNINYYTSANDSSITSNVIKEGDGELDERVGIEATYHPRPELEMPYKAPTNNTENLMVDIWRALLGIRGIGVEDDFFDLGGHSLLASQLVVRINENFQVKLPLDSIFNSPTILSLIENFNLGLIRIKEEIINDKSTNVYPLSKEQKRLWLINKIDGNIPAYNIPFTYKLNGYLNIELLEKSFQLLTERHLALKTYIATKDDEPFCTVHEDSFTINYVDVSNDEIGDVELFIQEFLGNEIRTSFDISKDQLIRLTVLKPLKEEFILHITVHHLVFDGWSWGIFSNELTQIYNDLLTGSSVRLSKLKLQYGNFSQWQMKNSQELINPKSVEFWRKQLEDCPLETKFPYDHKRLDSISGIGGREDIEVGEILTRKLKQISKDSDTTLFMTMLTAIGTLINFHSNEKDICIGTPTGNRTRSHFEKIIGFFVNTIVFRIKLERSLTFKDTLKANRATYINSLEHQDISFDEIVEIVQPQRVMNINPLFQIMFAWQNAPRSPFEFNDIESRRIVVNKGISPLDITFYMWEENNKILGEIEFNTDLLNRETVIGLKHNFIKLLQEITDKFDVPLSELSTASEYTQNVEKRFNNTNVEVRDKLLHQLFEDTALKFPDKEAVVSGSNRLTYKQLNNKANKLAIKLTKYDVKGNFVALSLSRTEEMLITILAILKAGANYLPLDPEFPDDRLIYILKDSGAKLLLTQSGIKDKFEGSSVQIILLDKNSILDFKPFKKEYKNLNLNIRKDELAYTIYTSGSTGNPKGVKVLHKGAVNFILSMAKTPGMAINDRFLAVTTLSFDISVLELFLPITVGATVVIADHDDIANGHKLIEILNDEKINVLQATPATWNVLLLSGWKGDANFKALCGGEAIQSGLIKNLLPKVGQLWNMYGPTETTVWSTCYKITDPEAPVLVGSPIDNTQIFILDRMNKPQPIGVYGEVCIGGEGVTNGYHNRKSLTAEKFIIFHNEVIYKTGDGGRILSSGQLELSGRLDNQIKLRGFRIEPGEIETLIGKEQDVNEVVVKVQQFEDLDERLIAFVTIGNGGKLDEKLIKASLGASVPNYMIPSEIIELKEFPKTPNGKIDKNKLDYKKQKRTVGKDVRLGKTAEKLAGIWEYILKIEGIKLHDNFFNIGGHSLLALKVINSIRDHFNVNMSLKEFMVTPELSEVADFIEKEMPLSSSIEIKDRIPQLSTDSKLPLTEIQRRIWFTAKLQNNPAYNISYTLKINGNLNRNVFKKALFELFNRHLILFSSLKEQNGNPYYTIERSPDITIIENLTQELDGNLREEEVLKQLELDAQTPFVLEVNRLFRIHLIQLETNVFIFQLTVHHVIFDGVSWGIFLKDLQAIYADQIKGKYNSIGSMEYYQYNFSDRPSNNVIAKQASLDYWGQQLNGIRPFTNFPYDKPRKGIASGLGKRKRIRLDANMSKKLLTHCKLNEVTSFHLLLSAFSLAINKYSGDNDYCIGTAISKRSDSLLNDLVGMFADIMPIRYKLDELKSFKDLVNYTKRTVLDGLEHQNISYNQTIEIVKPDRDLSYNPIFQIAFVWQDNLSVPFEAEGLNSELIELENCTTPFDLTFYMWENNGKIEGTAEYNTDILSPETVDRFVRNYEYMLNNILSNYFKPLDSVPYICDHEQEILSLLNDTKTNYPNNISVVELFKKQVSRNPNALAITYKENSLSYLELDIQSDKLAHQVVRLKTKENEPIGLLCNKSCELVIAILAILKTNGCYVPIDTDYPPERIKYILNDVDCKTILYQQSFFELVPNDCNKIDLDNKNNYDEIVPYEPIAISPEDVAYIMYTSGTTGKPKGSLIMHKSIIRIVKNTNYIDLTDADRILLTGSIGFDATTFEIWGALLNGGQLFLVDKDVLLSPDILGIELDSNQITTLWLTSPLFTQLAEIKPEIFKSLKSLLVGGDVLSVKHINQVRKAYPDLVIINGYGPTENTTFSTCLRIDKDYQNKIPIGKPVSNSTAYILDKDLNVVPIGVIGELFVGGDGVSKGYLNRPELNRTKFIYHPNFPGQKLYRTGDYASWNSDRNIEFHGRIDNQLKIRGFRVELGEVEATLLDMPLIKEAVVKIISLNSKDHKLVAFVNTKNKFEVSKNLSQELMKKLPSYMVPDEFVYMDNFPKTINGKIDKTMLTYDASTDLTGVNHLSNDLSAAHKTIIDIWCKALNKKRIGIRDNFFDIGGTSLLVLSVMDKIEKKFNVKLELIHFFENPTIETIENAITKLSSKENEKLDVIEKKKNNKIEGSV